MSEWIEVPVSVAKARITEVLTGANLYKRQVDASFAVLSQRDMAEITRKLVRLLQVEGYGL